MKNKREKQNRDNVFVGTWIPISLTDTKILLQPLSVGCCGQFMYYWSLT